MAAARAGAGGPDPKPPSDVTVSGELAKVILTVRAVRNEDTTLSPSEKNLLNLDLFTGRTDRGYQVIFNPHRAEGEYPKPGGRTSLGRAVKYELSADYRISSRLFFK